MGVFRAATVQMCSGVDPHRNIETMERLVREAAGQGARYVQTPEMTGALQRNRKALDAILREEKDDPVVAAGARLASELRIHLHIGSTAIDRGDGMIANRGYLFSPRGETVVSYDKIHMFDVDLANGESWRESAVYTPGAEAKSVSLPFAELGFAICYDVRFPELFRAQAVEGVEVMSLPAAFTRQTGEAHWHVLLRARAIENGLFVVAAAQAGIHEDGRETYGHSIIIDPWGKVLAEAGSTGETVILADIDTAEVAAARARIPNLRNARSFKLAPRIQAGGGAG
ncbi:carbon-nitrogen hydrolase family protein [Gellertiella hungarica]|uniref:Putative amidohydrolase n=1 Tax=Gellertiella hungarica TaxID=1572859 RepID=A0A7W6J5I6_9HYPH|nr:carbon-nitrogen hydrolase family protein [Gellertiella hungarica]MBB4065186.1 putative amidohydrolase [Gellertiella hungarica]